MRNRLRVLRAEHNLTQADLAVYTTGTILGAEERRIELVPEAGAMNIRYRPTTHPNQFTRAAADTATADFEWSDAWSTEAQLPSAVEITLFSATGETLPPLLRLPILVALGIAR